MLELKGAITEIVSNVCLAMLGLEVEPGPTRVAVPGERAMVACVQITGGWSGAVLVSCSPGFASLAAKTIFACPGQPSLDEERDAIGELGNMIAGNLKALLPGPSFLALPTVGDGVDGILAVLGSRPVETFELLAGGHQVTVVVVERAR